MPGAINLLGLAKHLRWNDSGVLRRHEVISPRDEVNRLNGRFYGEVLRMVIWPEASSAQNGGNFGHTIGAPPETPGTEAVSSTG